MYNCEELNPDFQVRWKVLDTVEDNDEIEIQLVGRIDDLVYLSFGVSGNSSSAQMVGGEVVVADYFGGAPRVRDFLMNAKGPCSVDALLGVCPEETHSFLVDSVSGAQEGGLTMLSYVATAGNRGVLNTQPGAMTSVIWALGTVDPASGSPSYHSIGASRSLIQFEFGREPEDNCAPIISNTTRRDDR